MNQSEDWLNHEDTVNFEDRTARLDQLAKMIPKADYFTFPGALMSKYLFEECGYCFVYGQFLAVIVLGASVSRKDACFMVFRSRTK